MALHAARDAARSATPRDQLHAAHRRDRPCGRALRPARLRAPRRSLRAPVVPDALGPRGFAALEVLAQGGGLTAADLDGRFPAVTAAGDAVGALAAYAGAFGLALGVGLPSFFHVILVVAVCAFGAAFLAGALGAGFLAAAICSRLSGRLATGAVVVSVDICYLLHW